MPDQSPLRKRMKRVEKELAELGSNLRSLSAGAPKGGLRGSGSEEGPKSGKVEQEVREIGKRIHDRRFADYLSTSFQPSRPLKHERRIQRNKAILMLVIALLALIWVVYRFFL